MFSLVYVSAAVTWFSPTELRRLLVEARARNTREGLTGMLLYKDGNFMQALEGPEARVRAMIARIAADRRHQGMVTICSGPASERQFGDWSMGFADLGAPGAALPEGCNRFLDMPLTAAAMAPAPQTCRALLQAFRELA